MSRIHHHALRLWSTPLSWSLGKGVEHYSAPYASFAPAVAARIDRLSPQCFAARRCRIVMCCNGKRNRNQAEDHRRVRVSSRIEAHGSSLRRPRNLQGSRGKCNFRHTPGRTCQARSTIAHSNGNARSPGEIEEVRAEAARDFDVQATSDSAGRSGDGRRFARVLQSARRN